MAENELETLLTFRFWNAPVVFVDELFKRSAKTGLTLLMFVGLPDVSVDKDKALGEEKVVWYQVTTTDS
ncbi:hypothetical protein E2L06_15385 [Haloterrigena sp. H1]|uniref:hypothetical protein n=1 Tax=Haloterrigena sp. H1 TaxID=2552943 RepID=UPI00110F2E8E|nr:hypothetical protein [Haloterrigena sp. H1]TMT81381.1 hypothetical protein E2L06_15385 [Haloterrigena sp. H1]